LTSSRLRLALDFATDCAVLWFAVWTLAAYLGMLTGAHVTLLLVLWLGGSVLATAGFVRWRRRSTEGNGGVGVNDEEAFFPWRGWVTVGGVAFGLTAAVLAGARAPWALVSIAALASVACAGVALLRARPIAAPTVLSGGLAADLVVIGTALAFAALSLFIRQGNADDAFYVNRATAVAQLNHIPVLDVIFTREEVARGGGAGLPVESYSALQGALARLIGLQAPSVSYYVALPVATFLAIWMLWRLLRAWTSRRALLCFALGAVFWLWSTEGGLTSGSYFLTRLWQGKAVFVVWLVPAIYVYLTKWIEERDAATAALLIATGIGAIGLTASATFAAPLVFLAGAIAVAASRDWRGMFVPLAAGAIPLIIGVVVLSRFPLSETFGDEPMRSTEWFYHQLFGFTVVATVAAAGVWLAPWLARPGAPARLAWGIAIVVAVILAPGILSHLQDVSGLTRTLRRTLWLVPFPTVVGLLASAPLPRRVGRMAPVAATAVVACFLIVFGNPVWNAHATVWDFPPRWKVSKHRMAVARSILRRYDGPGPILAREVTMRMIAIVTVEPKAVNARTLYLLRTREPEKLTEERLTLTDFVKGSDPPPSDSAVRRALLDLRVDLVCIDGDMPELGARLQAIAPYRRSFETRRTVCFQRRGDASGS
jgi:hypothetical protein